jgi:sirohydrochlorin cobaltochelatase
MLVGHGTKDDQGTQQFFQLGERLAERLSPRPVEVALLEFQQPTIPDAWTRLVRQGVEHVHIAPLLLFAAGHAKQDIPRVVRECQAAAPGVSFDLARPLSRHRSIVQLVSRRIGDTLASSAASIQSTALVMVGRGNTDPCAQADMRVLSEVISRRIDVAEVFTAFYAMADPPLPETLDRIARSGRFSEVVVHPHLLFTGRLYEAISSQVDQASNRFADVHFRLSSYLGPDPLVADALCERLGQIE